MAGDPLDLCAIERILLRRPTANSAAAESAGRPSATRPMSSDGVHCVASKGDDLDAYYVRAAAALSRLREGGKTLKQPGGALLDALIATVSSRSGALLVTLNIDDFRILAETLPLRVEPLADFMTRL